MSLEKNKGNKENKENKEEKNKENNYVENCVDYSSYELPQSDVDEDDGDQIVFEENDLNELALLGFFNDFALIDIGIHDLIREIYFED